MNKLQMEKAKNNIRSYLIGKGRMDFAEEDLAELYKLYESCPYKKDHISKDSKWNPSITRYTLLDGYSDREYRGSHPDYIKADFYILSGGHMWGGRHRRLYCYDRIRNAVYDVAVKLSKKKKVYIWDETVIRLNDKWDKMSNPGYGKRNGQASIYFIDFENSKYGEGWDVEGDFCQVNTRVVNCVYCGSSQIPDRTKVYHAQDEVWVRERYSFQGRGKETALPDVRMVLEGECQNKLCIEARKFMDGKHDAFDVAKELSINVKRPLKKWKLTDNPQEKILIALSALLDFEARVKIRQQDLCQE